MAAALALAESEGMSVNQGFLREAEAAVVAALCHETEGCQFFKGHDDVCSPVLIRKADDFDTLVKYVQPILATAPEGIADLIEDLIK